MPSLNSKIGDQTSFSSWTGGRIPRSLGTNAGAPPLAFQNWRRFKEAFAPELIARAVSETSRSLGRDVETCIDPFAGSGTTPLACQFLGVRPTAIEVNPYLSDLIEAKLTPVDGQSVATRLAEVLAAPNMVDPTVLYAGAPATLVEPGIKGRYLFSHDLAARIASLLDAITHIPEDSLQRFFRVMLGSAAIEVCNATVSGKGRRYRRNWQLRRSTASELDQHFVRGVKAAVYDSVRYASRRTLCFTLIRGNALRELRTVKDIDFAIFSPPYPNSFDYTDVYNIELWVLRYLKSPQQNTKLRHQTLRSHVQVKRDMTGPRPTAVVEKAIEQLRLLPKLWNPWIPDMIAAYFADLNVVMKELRRMLPDNGRVYVVIGDSKYSGIHIPVIEGFATAVSEFGYQVLDIEALASKRTSPQQGGRKELTESLITLAVR